MTRSVPLALGTSFIVHTAGDRKDTYSRALRCCVNAEECYRQLLQAAPGLRGRIAITKYVDGKVSSTYDLEQENAGRS